MRPRRFYRDYLVDILQTADEFLLSRVWTFKHFPLTAELCLRSSVLSRSWVKRQGTFLRESGSDTLRCRGKIW